MKIKSERELIILLERHFSRMEDSIIWLEVPNMGQSVDMVVQIGKRLYLIEAKLKNWETALRQCQAHQLVADYIYIAVATHKISSGLYNKAEELGYGILHLDQDGNSITEIIKAKRNKGLWKPQRNIFEDKLFNPNNYEFAPLDVV